jgi:NitT/TauT family transport system substrate-binding protein
MEARMVKNTIGTRFVVAALAALFTLISGLAQAENIKIGILKVAGAAPIYLGIEKGYFAAEGLTAEPVYFDAAAPIAVAAVSGDIDIGAVGTSAGMFSLGAQGALKIISGQAREFPGFQTLSFIVSNHAYENGFKSYKDLCGRSITVSQIGSGSHYSLTLIAEKFGVDLKTIRVLPLQSIPNQISAVVGGQADGAVVTSTPVMPAIERGDVRLMGFIGDVAPWQIGAVFTSTKNDKERHAMIERFLRAFRKGTHDYHDAFAGPDDKRRDGPMAPEVLAIIAKYTGQPVERIKLAIAYIDPEGRLDLKDLQHQIDWFSAQNLLKGNPKIADMLDKTTVVDLRAQ